MDTSLLDSSVASSVAEETEEDVHAVSAHSGRLPARRQTQTGRKPRTKGLVKKLQQQIDFYFGDSNLPKDKFLQQKIKEDPDGYIPVEVIAGFKKMKSLTEDVTIIKKAIDRSSIVELSEDREKVRRSLPLPEVTSADVDSRTIYVENFPDHLADHETIKKLFKMFGKITYVSLPRHKISGIAKGFAFIEFSTPEEATAALEFFKHKDKVAQTPANPPDVLSGETGKTPAAVSMETEDKEEEDEGEQKGGQKRKRDNETSIDQSEPSESLPDAKRQKTSPCSKDTTSTVLHISTCDEKQTNDQKSKSTEQCSKSTDQPSASNDQCHKSNDHHTGSRPQETSVQRVMQSSSGSPVKSSRLDSQSSETDELEEMEEGGARGGGQKKKRKNRQHKKKQQSAMLRGLDIRVLSKKEWSEFKKMYTDIQKDRMKQLKKDLKETEGGHKEESRERKGFVGHCLVRVKCSGEEGANTMEIKEVCSQFGQVAYADIEDGEKEGYVRYRSSGCVEKLLESDSAPPDTTFLAVNEEDERAYFLKCQAQRKQQFKSKGKRKLRGQDKLIHKALTKQRNETKTPKASASHIRFSDSDDDAS